MALVWLAWAATLALQVPQLPRSMPLSSRSFQVHMITPGFRDWRDFRQSLLVAERRTPWSAPPSDVSLPPTPPPAPAWWVHELAVPERGCVLLAQPHAIFPDQPLLHRAAVLVLEHSEEAGTVGVLLQRSTNRTVGALLARKDDLNLRPFRDRPLWIGGDVLAPHRRIRVLTHRCDVPGAREVMGGLWECTVPAAARMVAIGAARPSDFDLFAAACQWSPHKLLQELDAAVWLPVAASATALNEPVARSDELYFNLMEGVGGEYARQARITRSQAEVDEWLQDSASRAALVWRGLARLISDQARFVEDGEGGEGGEASAGGSTAPTLTPEATALCVHSALYDRDNLTDVWSGLDSFAEQASYIWFSQQLDVQMPQLGARADQHEDDPPRSPSASPAASPAASPTASPVAKPAAKPAKRKDVLRSRPPLQTAVGGYGRRLSAQDGLLSINLLLFEVCRYMPLQAGDVVAEHTSLAHLVRRSGGPASLFAMCVLYAAIARRIGLHLELVQLSMPSLLRAPRSPDFLLRLPAQGAQEELYVDISAEGRLRAPHDLPRYASLPMPTSQMREECVAALTPETFCGVLLSQLRDACEAAENLDEAVFWQVQLEVLEGQVALARDERSHRRGAPEPGAGSA